MNLKVGDRLLVFGSKKLIAEVYHVDSSGNAHVFDITDATIRGYYKPTDHHKFRLLRVSDNYFDKLKELIC